MRRCEDLDASGGAGAAGLSAAECGLQCRPPQSRSGRARWIADNVLPHEPWLRRWLQRRGFDHEAEDIVQESYALLIQADRVDHVRHPRNYFCQTARSIILRQARRDAIARFECISDPMNCAFANEDPLQDEALASRQELGLVLASLEVLPARTRDVFTLRRLEGLSLQATAERLGISQSAVEKHLRCAMRTLASICGRASSRCAAA